MVRAWRFALLAAMLCSLDAVAAVHISIKADKQAIMLGEPLTVQVRVTGGSEPVNTIALDQLKQNFDVYSVSATSETRQVHGHPLHSETMTLVLYPLRSGRLQLPALSYHGQHSNMVSVKVAAPGQGVQFKTALDVAHPLVRQATTLTLEIYDDGTLQWTVPHQLDVASAYQRWLAESQREEVVDGKRYTVHRYRWQVIPLREGVMQVAFPLLEAFRLGTRLRYPVAGMEVYVTPVPAYLPVQVPIGKPEITAEPLPPEIALGRPLNWSLKIRHAGLSEEGARKLLPALANRNGLKFYPVQIAADDAPSPAPASRDLRVTIPFVAQAAGNLQLPAIRLPYYDIALARLETIALPPVQVHVYSPAMRLAERVVYVVLALMVAGWSSFRLYHKIGCLRNRRRLIAAIRAAETAEALRALLMNCGHSKGGGTLQQWLQSVQQQVHAGTKMAALVQQLEAILYGVVADDAEIRQIADAFAGELKQADCRMFNKPSV